MGAWCLKNENDPYKSISKLTLIRDPVFGSELYNYSQASKEISECLLKELIPKLNKTNNVNYSYDFWRIMALPWLLTLVQTTWERKLRVDFVLEKYCDEKCSIKIVNNNINWNFMDSLAFLENGVHNSMYNDWLFSRLFEKYIPEKWDVEYYDSITNTSQSNNKNGGEYYKNNIKNIIRKIFRCRGVYGLNKVEELLFSSILHIKPYKKRSRKNKNRDVLINKREKPLIDFLEKIVPLTIPNSLLLIPEEKSSSKNVSKKNKYYVIGPYLNWEDRDKYFYAKKVEDGERLVMTQHGSNYGTSKTFSFPGEIEYKQSYFISWGWSEQDFYKNNIKPLPSPYLTKFSKKKIKLSNKLILAGTKEYLYSYRFSSLPQPLERLNSLKEKKQFIQNLNPNLLSFLDYYIYPDEINSFTNSKYIANEFPVLNIKKSSLVNNIFQTKLLVLDHPGTTLNIALSSNIPTICFFNLESWDICDQAKPYFELLLKANIIFYSGLETAEKVNEIWDNVDKWWGQKDVVNARNLWVNKFAHANINWRIKWIKTLWKL